jgi:hypothetical protein
MATTLANIQTAIAYRLGEDSAASGTEKTRRTQFINEGYFNVIRRHYWWFTETTGSFTSVADQTSYGTADGVPTDIRDSMILELRFGGVLHTPMLQTEAFDTYNSTYASRSQSYFIFNKKIYPVPVWSSVATVDLKYYKIPSKLSADADTVLIPDEYADCLVAFGLARVLQVDDERGSAADAMEEFEETLRHMITEQNNYMFALKSQGNEELIAAYE